MPVNISRFLSHYVLMDINDIIGILILLGPLIGAVTSLTLTIIEKFIQKLTHHEVQLTRNFMVLFLITTYSFSCYILITNLEITILRGWLHLIYYIISIFGNLFILWKLTEYLQLL